ncbi:ABC transporter permease [Nocardioides marinquilinus]|uniref:ABC transporter permease n=1 Tax=Nocardioides marinquilinus TaxID=1210400 RepID=A0ABP9Q193_9ACTN
MTATLAPEQTHADGVPDLPRVGFGAALHAEWIKLRTVRSTGWTLAAFVLLGAGLTVLICALNAEWLASGDADESPGSFITWGMLLAPVCAVVLGALVVTSEYATGMVRSTFAAVPRRGTVMAAKAVLVTGLLLVVGTVTALLGYLGGNWFLDREGIGMALEGDVLRAIVGSGLYVAGIGLLTAAVGFVVRHTAGTISLVLAVLLVVGNMVMLVPGTVGEWLEKLMPGNAGGAIASPVPFNPNLLDAWNGFGVFALEVAAVCLLAWTTVRRRDA